MNTVKKALDDYGKLYWSKYLENTGMDKQLLKVAINEVTELVSIEDELTPHDLRKFYITLAKKYESNGGLEFIRNLRSDLIEFVKKEIEK